MASRARFRLGYLKSGGLSDKKTVGIPQVWWPLRQRTELERQKSGGWDRYNCGGWDTSSLAVGYHALEHPRTHTRFGGRVSSFGPVIGEQSSHGLQMLLLAKLNMEDDTERTSVEAHNYT